MRSFAGLLLVLAVTVSGSLATPASAKEVRILSKEDKRGDVKLLKSKKISTTKKKSIDIDRASIVRLDNGRYRYKVRIKKIFKSKSWDQMVFFSSSVPGGKPTVYTSVNFKLRSSGGAYGWNSTTEESCKLKVRRSGRYAWVDVPPRCAAYDGDLVRVGTATGRYQSDENLYSSDAVRLGIFDAGSTRVLAVAADSDYEAVCQFVKMNYAAGDGTFALRCSPFDIDGRDSSRYVDDFRYYESDLAQVVTGKISANELTLDPEFGSGHIEEYQYFTKNGSFSDYFWDYRDFEKVQTRIPRVLTNSSSVTFTVHTDHDLFVDYYNRDSR